MLGSVEISGFSDYMHPLDPTHLLTIGRETQVMPEGWTQDIGLQLQIFDVSDPMAPKRTQHFVYTRQGYSAANNEHKAFTYYADKGLLAFPFVSYDANFASSLEVFHVDVDAGFQQLGSIEHGQLIASECLTMYGVTADVAATQPYYYYSCVPSPEVRRGTLIDNFVYSVSYGGVLVHSLDNLSQAVASVPLPPPSYSSGISGGKDVTAPGGATVGAGSPGTATPAPQDAGVAVGTDGGV